MSLCWTGLDIGPLADGLPYRLFAFRDEKAAEGDFRTGIGHPVRLRNEPRKSV